MSVISEYGETVDGNLKQGARDVYELCDSLIKERDRLRAERDELVEVLLDCKKALGSLEVDALGFAHNGHDEQWPILHELQDKVDRALNSAKPDEFAALKRARGEA